ncbi:hypothetical protein AAMO2058_001486800 [Amorphochlora amoebiformis]
MENYVITELIGEGSFGKVYKGRRRFTGKAVAMKFIVKLGKKEKDLQALLSEVEILQKLQHPNIIQMLDVFETKSEICVVTELAQGELFDVLEDDKSLPEPVVRTIAQQVVCALDYLHSHRIIHRDIKPQNILFCSGGRVALCDFGFARLMSQNTTVLTSIKGTPLYMAPELVKEQPYNHAADLWSLGVILYELRVGKPPFFTNNIYKLIRMIVHDPVRWPSIISPQMRSFLELLLVKDPLQRGKWSQVRSHPWISAPSHSCRNASKNALDGRLVASAPPKNTFWVEHEEKSRDPEQALALKESKEFNDYVLSVLSEAGDLKKDLDAKQVVGALRTMSNVFRSSLLTRREGGGEITRSTGVKVQTEEELKKEIEQSGCWIGAIFSMAHKCLAEDKDSKVSVEKKGSESLDETRGVLLTEGLKTCTIMASTVFESRGSIGVPDEYARRFLPLAPKFLAFSPAKRKRSPASSSNSVQISALEFTSVLLRQASADPQKAQFFYQQAVRQNLPQALTQLTASGGEQASSFALRALASLVHPIGGEVSNSPLSARKSSKNKGPEETSVMRAAEERGGGEKENADGRLDAEVRKSVAGALEMDRRILSSVLRHLIEAGHGGGELAAQQAQASLQILLHTSRISTTVAAGVMRNLSAVEFLSSLAKANPGPATDSQIGNSVRGLGLMLMSVLCQIGGKEISSAVNAKDIVRAMLLVNKEPAEVRIAASYLCAALAAGESKSGALKAVDEQIEHLSSCLTLFKLPGDQKQAFDMSHLEGSSFGIVPQGVLDGYMSIIRSLANSGQRSSRKIVESGIWTNICQQITRPQDGALSLEGLESALETIRLVSANSAPAIASMGQPGKGGNSGRIFSDTLILALVGFCREGMLKKLRMWPEDVGGGTNAVGRLLSKVISVLAVPFQESGGSVLALEKAKVMKAAFNKLLVRHLLQALRNLPPAKCALGPVSFLCRLVLEVCRLVLEDRRGFFARQFAEHRGPAALVRVGLLSPEAEPNVFLTLTPSWEM